MKLYDHDLLLNEYMPAEFRLRRHVLFIKNTVMRYFIRCFIICGFTLSFFSCNSHQHKNEFFFNNSSKTENGGNEKDVLMKNTNAIGPFHWGINDDGFCKILAGWTKQLTKNGFVIIAGIKVKNNGIVPHYDKDGHLEKITIEFQKFGIHPEPDYTEEEKSQFKQMYLTHNQEIKRLINTFSDIYGDAIETGFEDNSDEIYALNGTKTLTDWQTKETHVSLNIQNKTVTGMTGCEMRMWLELKKTN